MPPRGCAAENAAPIALRDAIQMSAPPIPPARSDSKTIVNSFELSAGAAAFEFGRFSSAIAAGVPNGAASLWRLDTKMSLRTPAPFRVDEKYIRSRPADSHGRA